MVKKMVKANSLKAKPSEPQKLYRLGAPHYRKGRMYETGDIIRVAASEQPSITWTEVDEDGDPIVEVEEGAEPVESAEEEVPDEVEDVSVKPKKAPPAAKKSKAAPAKPAAAKKSKAAPAKPAAAKKSKEADGESDTNRDI